jgi:hypothetical protein
VFKKDFVNAGMLQSKFRLDSLQEMESLGFRKPDHPGNDSLRPRVTSRIKKARYGATRIGFDAL